MISTKLKSVNSTKRAPRRVFVIGGSVGYSNWCQATELVDRMEDADLAILTGGEDISSSIYNEPAHPSTYCTPSRDKYELAAFDRALELQVPLLTICRGAQLTCARLGGKLVQDQPNPAYLHPMQTFDGKTLMISSMHHQAMWPWNLKEGEDFHVLAWTTHLSSYHEGGYGEEMVDGVVEGDRELEIAYFLKAKALCIQGHPEMMYRSHRQYDDYEHGGETISYLRGLLDDLLNGTLLSRINRATLSRSQSLSVT